MARLTRVLQEIFGSTAGTDERAQIGSLAAGSPAFTTDPAVMQALANFKGGLFDMVIGENSPPIEDMNSLYYLITRQIAYMLQNGVAEYDVTTTYYIGQITSDGAGNLYRSLTDTNLGNALSDFTKWEKMGVNESNTIDALLVGGRTVPITPYGTYVVDSSHVTVSGAVALSSPAYHPSGKIFVTADTNVANGLKVFDIGSEGIMQNGDATFTAVATAKVTSLAISPDGKYLGVAYDTTPFIGFFEISRDLKTFTKLTNPTTLPTASASFTDVVFSPCGQYFILANGLGTGILTYRKQSTGLFQQITSPSITAASVGGVSFSPNGKFLAVAYAASPYLKIYSLSYVNQLLTATAVTITGTPTTAMFGIEWAKDGSYLCVAGAGGFTIFKNNTTSFNKVTQSDSHAIAAVDAFNPRFYPDNKYIFIGRSTTNEVYTINKNGIMTYVLTIADSGPRPSLDGSLLVSSFGPEFAVYRNPNKLPSISGKYPRYCGRIGESSW